MVNWLRGGCIAMLAPLVLQTAGVAGAVPPSVVKETGDYLVTLSLKDVGIQTVPNMAGAPFVREGFITATSILEIACKPDKPTCDKTAPTATLNMTAQVGCPVDVSGGINNSWNPTIGSSLPLQGILAAILPPQPTPPSDVTDIAVLPNGSIQPNVTAKPLPGYIRDEDLGSMKTAPKKVPDATQQQLQKLDEQMQKISAQIQQLTPKEPDEKKNPNGQTSGGGTTGGGNPVEKNSGVQEQDSSLIISVQNHHIEVDNVNNVFGSCGGTVTVRIYATAEVETNDSIDTVDIYSDIYTL